MEPGESEDGPHAIPPGAPSIDVFTDRLLIRCVQVLDNECPRLWVRLCVLAEHASARMRRTDKCTISKPQARDVWETTFWHLSSMFWE